MSDALLAMRKAIDPANNGVLTTYCADYNCDGRADMIDAIEIIRAALG